jgi:hypothetical protein
MFMDATNSFGVYGGYALPFCAMRMVVYYVGLEVVMAIGVN